MKLYTKTGDKGQTGLVGGRTDKDSLRVESYGTIDELNSFIGLALAELSGQPGFEDLTAELLTIQHELFDCGGDLAFISLIKDTSLASQILVAELFRKAQEIGARNLDQILVIYIEAAFIYWIICFLLSLVQHVIERRLFKNPRFSQQQSDVLISIGDYYFTCLQLKKTSNIFRI